MDEFKRSAARHALTFVQNGMALGLGTGSTTAFFTAMLAEQLRSGSLRDVVVVPTSETTATQARDLGIPLTTLGERPQLDLAVDGADEVDPALNLIKGLGRALLREKIVALHAERFIVIVDQTKLVERLGSRVPLPIEIVPFAADAHVRWLNTLGCSAELWREAADSGRAAGSPVVTDNGNYLVRCVFAAGIAEPYALASTLDARPGIVEHGLFLDLASLAIVAGEHGLQELARRP